MKPGGGRHKWAAKQTGNARAGLKEARPAPIYRKFWPWFDVSETL
jgi:hypothetical protein